MPGRPQLGHPGVVEARGRIGRLDCIAGGRNARPRLAGMNRRADAGRRKVQPDLVRDAGEAQGVGRRRQQNTGANIEHVADALLACHRATRYAQRPKPVRASKRRPESDERTE